MVFYIQIRSGPLQQTSNSIYRILDANCNRLREALRVIEEYYRFVADNEAAAVELKLLRHELTDIEKCFEPQLLLKHRDSANDCFADSNRPEEIHRSGADEVLTANFKRAQEAARVIEEYAKVINTVEVSERAKRLRFSLYRMEQRFNGD